MTDLANVMALLEGDELDDKTMIGARREVLARYVEAAGDDPWLPAPSRG